MADRAICHGHVTSDDPRYLAFPCDKEPIVSTGDENYCAESYAALIEDQRGSLAAREKYGRTSGSR